MKAKSAKELTDLVEEWSKENPEQHSAAFALSDEDNVYVHWSGEPSRIAKNVTALMKDDAEIGEMILRAVTMTAFSFLPVERIKLIVSQCETIKALRAKGYNDEQIVEYFELIKD